MLLSIGQMSDYNGAALMLAALSKAKELLGDKGYDADWFRTALVERGITACISLKSSRKKPIEHDLMLYRQRPKSRICSARSRTGDVSIPVTTDAPIPSCQQSASQPSSSSGCDQWVLSLILNCNWMSRSIGLQALNIILRWRRLVLQNRRAVIGASILFDKACGARALNRLSFGIAFWIFATVLMVANAKAQDAEPRSYTNTPVGLNFLIAGYVYSEGKIAFDPDSSIVDAQFHANTGVLAYARSLDVWGKSAKFDVILPYSSFSAHGLVDDQPRERAMSGFGDPRFRFSINLYGAPALSVKEFANYQQDLIIGVSVQVSAPLGQYDNSKLLNLGNNRWSFRPELGISKAWGPWTVEVAPSVAFFTDNTDFLNGSTFAQAPIYLVQGHIIYNFPSGVWVSLDGTYFTGGRTTLNGVRADNEQTNTRAGLTLALPVDRYNSIKLAASTGISTRTGSEFSAVGVAWQYRWGAGY